MSTATAIASSTPPRTAFGVGDRLRREHVGQVARVVWAADDDSRCILALADRISVIAAAAASRFTVGDSYRFYGRFEDSAYGPQFRADTFTTDEPLSESAVVRYLAKHCRGVGEAKARRLFALYGQDAVRVLREDHMRPVRDGVMNESDAAVSSHDLATFKRFERTQIDLFELFRGRGFQGKLIERVIGLFGVAAPDVVRRNPYTLLVRKLPSAGFKRCDKLYLDLGRPPAAMKRQAIAGWQSIRDDRSGSTWVDAKAAAMAIREKIPTADAFRALKVLARAKWIEVDRTNPAEKLVALRDHAEAERRVADSIRRLNRYAPSWPTDLRVSVADGDGLPSAHQVDEYRRASAGCVACFVGGPGTGKTFTLSFVLQSLIHTYGRSAVAVIAPTGKASVRAGESLRARGLDIQATTIHRFLEIGRNGHDGDGWGFIRNRRNPIDQRFVIVDESSMIDAGLMADLLDAIPDGGHVLFVGDPYQLPPVGHGAPLRDMLAAKVPSGELSEVRRNAGSVVRACVAIKAGTPVVFDDKLDPTAADPKNLRLIECVATQTATTVLDVVKAITRWDRIWEVQVITGLNDKSDASRKKLNEKLGPLLNPDGRAANGCPFKVGDKIICRRNTRLKVVTPCFGRRDSDPDAALDTANYAEVGTAPGSSNGSGGNPGEWYVANGEMGRVVAVGVKGYVVRFGGANVPLVKIGNKKGRSSDEERADGDDADGGVDTGDFQPGWAITVHSSQGSEWPCVVCVIDDAASQISDRNYWYTAISRARSACLVVGPKTVFDRQIKKVSSDKRKTRLAEIIVAERDEI